MFRSSGTLLNTIFPESNDFPCPISHMARHWFPKQDRAPRAVPLEIRGLILPFLFPSPRAFPPADGSLSVRMPPRRIHGGGTGRGSPRPDDQSGFLRGSKGNKGVGEGNFKRLHIYFLLPEILNPADPGLSKLNFRGNSLMPFMKSPRMFVPGVPHAPMEIRGLILGKYRKWVSPSCRF